MQRRCFTRSGGGGTRSREEKKKKRPNISNDSALKGNATTDAKIIVYLNDSDKDRDKGKTRLYVSLSFWTLHSRNISQYRPISHKGIAPGAFGKLNQEEEEEQRERERERELSLIHI